MSYFQALRSLAQVKVAVLICISWCFSSASAMAEYRIAAGDVIEFSVAGVPDLKQKAPIDVDGKVTLPLTGSIDAAGLTLTELRARVASLLSQKEFRQRGYNKIERDVIGGDEIVISISEYRPIYVDGDVSRPGSQPYRPGLTARQAVSLAGGYDLLRSRIQDPILQSADLQGSYTTGWLNFAKELAHVKRLKAELGENVEADEKQYAAIPLSPDSLSRIAAVEDQELKVSESDHSLQIDHLHRLQEQLVANRDIMEKRHSSESEGLEADEGEYEKIQDTYKKGLAPNTRMAEARRIVLLSSIQSLQSAVELERAKTDLEKASREIGKYESERQLKLMKELRDANASLLVLQSDIQVAGEKLRYVGMRRSLGREGESQVTIRVVRNAQELAAAPDIELQPADLVEVKLDLAAPQEAVR